MNIKKSKRIEKIISEEVVKINNMIFGTLVGMNNTFRFSGRSLIKNQSVTEHSYWVAVIAGEITKVENIVRKFYQKKQISLSDVYQFGLFHDLEEVYSGDINHEFKYFNNSVKNETFRKQLDEMIIMIMEEKMKNFPTSIRKYVKIKDNEIKTIIKLADWLQLFQYIKNEELLGSKSLLDVKERINLKLLELIDNSNLFIKRFIKSLIIEKL